MRKFHFKLLIILTLVFSLILVGCNNSKPTYNISSDPEKINNKLLVHFIDVGQGDSILVQVNDKNLLIDAGPESNKDSLLQYLKSKNIKKLNYVLATHPHEDHIGGMDDVIKAFDVDKFYSPKIQNTTKTYTNMIKALNDKNLKLTVVRPELTLDLGKDVTAEFLAPNKDEYKDLNDYSAVLKITYKNNSFLFTGDAEALSEKEILSKDYNVKSDVLKLGHHGSSSSTSNNFLDKVSPSIVVASLAKGNDYGHPHKETLKKIKDRNLKFYRTDESGTILLESDGTKIYKKD